MVLRIRDEENTIYISLITRAEVAASFGKRYRLGDISEDQHRQIYQDFQADVKTDYKIVQVEEQVVSLAMDLATNNPLRGYDSVQLATALLLNRKLLIMKREKTKFVSADQNLCLIALKEGLVVLNIEKLDASDKV
jgi:predicted nucleic acid-binding protein